MNARNFFSKSDLAQLKSVIRKSEQNTSGEIRVHITNNTEGTVLNAAWLTFEKLQMHKTTHRNGVLIYISVKDHKLAIVGDEGINEKTSDSFWNVELQALSEAFKQKKYLEGTITAIMDVGEKLKAYFPKRHDDNKNELPNDISIDA